MTSSSIKLELKSKVDRAINGTASPAFIKRYLREQRNHFSSCPPSKECILLIQYIDYLSECLRTGKKP